MTVASFDIRSRRPYFDGQEWGDAGVYERIDGILHFAVDPGHRANAAIIDLDRAPRDDAGRVRFQSDFCILKPVDSERGSGRLLLDVPNRGRKVALRHFNRAPQDVPPRERINAGDGFLFKRGYTVAFIGWQWDVIRSEALMGLEPPIAMQDGQPLRGTTIIRFQPTFSHSTHLLADRVHKPYPAADVDGPDATLVVKEYDSDTGRTVPRSDWQFAREENGIIIPDDSHIYYAGGFQPGLIYEVYYQTAHSPVVGTGLLAIRDAGSFLRYSDSDDNPCAGTIEYAFTWGISQTGRLLRHFTYLGLNLDEEGRMAFDGIMPHVGGGRRGEFNHRYGQPSLQNNPGMGYLPPYDDASLIARQSELGGVPKIIQTNSSAEYYRGDAALMNIDTSGSRDLPPESGMRSYAFASTQHGPGVVPLTNFNTNDGGIGRYGFNVIDYTPLMRAAIVNMDRWVSEDVEPPASQHPRLEDNTAVTRDHVFEAFESLPGSHKPDASRQVSLWRVDPGEKAGKGIVRYPVVIGDAYPDIVSAVDSDLNEVAGIRLPDVAVPVGTHLGWNPRDPETGSPEQIMSMQGSTLWFRRTRAERDAASDPRASLEERYASRDDYLSKVRAAAEELVSQRYLLEEDIDTVLADAAERYDEAMKG
jgi:hypothetical protein